MANMFKKPSFFTRGPEIPKPMVAAVIISVVALAAALGTARWSWLLLDEQIKLREEFMQLRNTQEQTAIQYEFWLEKLQAERAATK
jgi:hypothetical protein